MEKILYYELITEYGPLYIYKRYQCDPENNSRISSRIPLEIKEFFTRQEGTRGYDSLSFLGANFRTLDRTIEGLVRTDYMRELTPAEFLSKVSEFLEPIDKFEEKRKEVYRIFDMKVNNIRDNLVNMDELLETEEQKNEKAVKILSKYLKNDKNQ